MKELTEFQKQAVTVALQKMFKGSHFNICTVRECLEVTGAIPPKDALQELVVLHCVNWSDMDPEFRQQVFLKTLALFTHSGFAVDKLFSAAAAGALPTVLQ